MLGRQGTGTELAQGLLVHEVTHSVLLQELHLLVLVRSAESVEEVDEGHSALNGSQVSHSTQVHNLLHRALAQHGETSLAASHHVAVVTEDTQRVCGQSTGRHMEDAGKQFTGNLVHVRNHQQQTLAGSECCCQSTSLQ